MNSLVAQYQTDKNIQNNIQSSKQTEHICIKQSHQIKNTNHLLTLPQKQYTLKPCIQILLQMDINKLQEVQDFSVSNEFGKIVWPGLTDLTYVNLHKEINISQNKIEVYPDKLQKPQIGQKLNKRSILYYFNIFVPQNQTKDNFVEFLKSQCIRQDAQFINYDEIKGILQIQVFHFTTYGFSDLEDDQLEESDEHNTTSFTHQHIDNQQKDQHVEQDTLCEKNNDNYNQVDDMKEQIEYIQESKQQENEYDDQQNIQNLLSIPQLDISYRNKKSIQSINGQDQIVSVHQDKKDQEITASFDSNFNMQKEDYDEQQQNIEQKEKLDKQDKIIEEELQDMETERFNQTPIQFYGQQQTNITPEGALMNKILQSDKITKKSQGMTKDIEVPSCFLNDNQHIMIDNRIFQNNLQIKHIDLFEIQQRDNIIMNDIVGRLLSDLTEYFCINEQKIADIIQNINNAGQSNIINKQDLFLILFMFNLQKKLEKQNFAFWFLYVKLINDLFMGHFFSLQEHINEKKDFDYQIQLLENCYINQVNLSQQTLIDSQRRQISNWCYFVEKLMKHLNENQFTNDKLYEFEYDYNFVSFDLLIQPKQDLRFIKNTVVYQFKKYIQEEYIKDIFQLFDEFLQEDRSQKTFLDQLFMNMMLIYISQQKNDQSVESIVLLDKYCDQNKIYHFFQHLLFQAISFKDVNFINRKEFKRQYQWNFKNLEYFLGLNEYNLQFLVISNMMINPNILDLKQLKQQALYQHGSKIVLQKVCQNIIKFFYGYSELQNTLSQKYLQMNDIQKYIHIEQSNQKKLNVYMKVFIKEISNPRKNKNTITLSELLRYWEQFFKNEKAPQYMLVQEYLEFIEKYNQQNLDHIIEKFYNFVFLVNKCINQTSIFFYDHEDTIRQMQTQMLQKLFDLNEFKNYQEKTICNMFNKLQQQNLQLFINQSYVKEFANNLMKLNN